MIFLLLLLVIIAVFIGMYNVYARQKSQIIHLFKHIEPLLHQHIELFQQQIAEQKPLDADTDNRMHDLVWRLKSRNTRINERVLLYNRINALAKNIGTKDNNEQIQQAFDAYNAAVQEYNDMLSKFPTRIIAALFNHHKMKAFE